MPTCGSLAGGSGRHQLAAPATWMAASGALDFSCSDIYKTVWQQTGEIGSPAPIARANKMSPRPGEQKRKEVHGISSFLSAVW